MIKHKVSSLAAGPFEKHGEGCQNGDSLLKQCVRDVVNTKMCAFTGWSSIRRSSVAVVQGVVS